MTRVAALPLLLLLACSGDPGGTGTATAEPGRETGETGHTAETGDTGDTGDSADPPPELDETTDVVVIGAGVAGLTATADAAAAGADVVTFERDAGVGGAAMYAGGLMLFSGSSEQADAGVVDSAEVLAAEWPAFTGGDPTSPWFQLFATGNVPRVHDWLAELGVTWGIPGGDASSGPTPRVHQVNGGGRALVEALLKATPPGVLRLSASVTGLVMHEGRAVGVRWTDAEGEHSIGAGAIVVTTGGFLRDLDRVQAVFPELELTQATYASAPSADGNGLDMLEALGASTTNLQAIGFYAHGAPSPLDPRREVGTPAISGFPWVNIEAERFADETGTNSFIVGRTRAFQPGGLVWLVADAQFLDVTLFDLDGLGGSYDITDLEAAGLATASDSLAGLAGELGVDAEALDATIASWNRVAAGTEVDAWRPATADLPPTVQTAPFYALPVATSLAKNFGGVTVDLDGRVLDTAGQPIPGVFAAGELTGMCGGSIVGDYGFTGSLSCVVLGGRVAGEAAAVEALSLRP